jgi:release factor glutamine methyltransferase
VLIPRPETELIVEAALELLPARAAPLAAADLGTGSGCLAVALAVERPAARLVATDISSEAIAVARRNATRHGVDERIRFIVSDLAETIGDGFDLIVANPPYVLDRDRPGLQPEVREHEPDVALYGGDNGLRIIERVVREAPAHIRSGGWLIFEFGFGQDEHIERFLEASPDLEPIGLRRDLQGIARTAVAKRL